MVVDPNTTRELVMPRKSKKPLSGKAGEVFSKMPYLDHNPTGDFDPALSEVFDWIRDQPEIMNWILQKARDAQKIKYDPFLEKWHGAEL